MDTFNKYAVGVRGERIVIMLPPHEMSKQDALTLAAWLVTLADDDDQFPSVLVAVQNA